jgi:hypothetical protein
MPQHMQGNERDLANHQLVAVGNQLVKLGSVAGELGPVVENLAEHALGGDDFATDDELAAELFRKVGRGRLVIGMGMGFEDPVDGQSLRLHIGDDRVGGFEACPAEG